MIVYRGQFQIKYIIFSNEHALKLKNIKQVVTFNGNVSGRILQMNRILFNVQLENN